MPKITITNSTTGQSVVIDATRLQMENITEWASCGELAVTVDADGKPIDMTLTVQLGPALNHADADPSFVSITPSKRLPPVRPIRIPIRPLADNTGGKFDAKHEIDNLKQTVRQLTDYVNELRRDVDKLQGYE